MATFSKQCDMPNLPVPPLNETLDKYLKSVRALVDDAQFERTRSAVAEFRDSDLARQLQESLENRAKLNRNWLEEWWYDVYNEVREPLAPYLSVTAINSFYPPVEGSQIGRAADIAHHWMQFRQKIRLETIPITRSRGSVWDMHQYHCLFNSVRIPALPKDKIERYFKTVSEGECPSHIVVFCRGAAWKVEMLRGEEVRSADELYKVFSWIWRNSIEPEAAIMALTTQNRDTWAKQRVSLMSASPRNEHSLALIEQATFCMTLAEEVGGTPNRLLEKGLTADPSYFWMDKSVNLVVYADGQMALQGEHSNVDAIVILHAGDDSAARVRKTVWTPKDEKKKFEVPSEIRFDLPPALIKTIHEAETIFKKNRGAQRVNIVRYNGYGNDLLKNNKLYTDTVIQIALQLAFLKTHGSFAPIYETASTRKFYHGRTETVRGCTTEMVELGREIMEKGDTQPDKLGPLFMAAYNAHNHLMNECTEGRGIDRHLLGLRNTLALFGKGCSPKRSLPKMFCDEAWKATGGDGNFLLSTSFTGYMLDHEDGGHGYVCAMKPDGYGVFYRVGRNRLLLVTSDWEHSNSNLDAFESSLHWAFDLLGTLFSTKSKQ